MILTIPTFYVINSEKFEQINERELGKIYANVLEAYFYLWYPKKNFYTNILLTRR